MMPLCHYLFIWGLNQYSDSGFLNVATRMMPTVYYIKDISESTCKLECVAMLLMNAGYPGGGKIGLKVHQRDSTYGDLNN